MSLNRRNLIAWLLILLSAICWSIGQPSLEYLYGSETAETTAPMQTTAGMTTPNAPFEDSQPTTEPSPPLTSIPFNDPSRHFLEEPRPEDNGHNLGILGLALCLTAIVLGFIAIFPLRQISALMGPDGGALMLAAVGWMYLGASLDGGTIRFLSALGILLSGREVWGWLAANCSLGWCAVSRLAGRLRLPQGALMLYLVWVSAGVIGILGLLLLYSYDALLCIACCAVTVCLGICCLWKYGGDLNHFRKQLDHFQQGQPITVGDGAFAETEAQLLEIQARHEEAVRSAVTSERFKVELISNVSHDLRTPLTAILGYGELLRQEALSPAGQEQLDRLNRKAGYMRDLVDSLFELTKVSSGVLEPKKSQIDLIRLLEQTIGLFDDQLSDAALVVRRHYSEEAVPVVTDGARMHQVFANLLGNAIKYALAGTRIHLEVSEQETHYTIRMVNTASYEMDFQPEEILQRFARGDKARSTKGSGIGLAIAQTYTESVGGQFRVAVDGDQFSAIVTLPKTERNL